MVQERNVERELIRQLQSATEGSQEAQDVQVKLKKHNQQRFPGFTLVGDNVDFQTHARYFEIYTITRK